MSLNPVKFGKDVIDQFGRYLRNSFPIADENIAAQFNEKLRYSSDSLIAKGPYIYLNKPFIEGKSLSDLINEIGLHRNIKDIFKFPSMHSHQEKAARLVIKDKKNIIISTGTGSGKTESFLLPVVDYCLKAIDNNENKGLMAVIVYPMNALVNDQLERLRPLLAGTGITFARYTGETPQNETGVERLEQKRGYTEKELSDFYDNKADLPIPREESYSRDEIVKNRPNILLTNYSQLEYLLLRDKDLDIFTGKSLKYLVLDEVHTYTGELGSEMACLLRRIKSLMRENITCIGTSATVAGDGSGAEVIKKFAAGLFGEKKESFEVIEEEYKESISKKYKSYISKIPENPELILTQILDEVKSLYLQTEIDEITPELLRLGEKLTGSPAASDGGKNIDKLGGLLVKSDYINLIEDFFSKPSLPSEVFPALKNTECRKSSADNELEAELLSYLILGAVGRFENEPVIRPKLHYFIRGAGGAKCTVNNENELKLFFDNSYDKEKFAFSFKVCRDCGQHFFDVVTEADPLNEDGIGVYQILRNRKDGEQILGDEKSWYITNKLNELDENSESGIPVYLCSSCGAVHLKKTEVCMKPKCRKSGTIVKMALFEGDMKYCPSCSTSIMRGSYNMISEIRSVEVSDVMIIGQSMLSAMPEKELQKLLIFADSRQDAAFQAAWMNMRSKRFNMRYLNYTAIKNFKSEFDNAISFDKMVSLLTDEAFNVGIYKDSGFNKEAVNKKIKWFLIDEYVSTRQKSNLERIGLVSVVYYGLNENYEGDAFIKEWAQKLRVTEEKVINTITLMLNYLRKRGAVNDELARRLWSYTDSEVRDGIIPLIDEYRPGAFVLEKNEALKDKGYVKGLISSNGRSGVEVIYKKSFPGSLASREFLENLWEYLNDKNIICESRLIVKKYGKFEELIKKSSKKLYQINKDVIGFKSAQKIYRCCTCREIFNVMPENMKCMNYNCKGSVVESALDTENYDIVQYTMMNYTPMKSFEHSAQVPKDDRASIEKEFKKNAGTCNCLVATPTLELGVDIGKLEMVLMRNVPPATPNYTQRSGRAGRKHRIATVFTYVRNVSHDNYFYNNPPEMITGTVRIPAFSMRNKPLITKHIRSAVMTWLRLRRDEKIDEILNMTFPLYIKNYISYIDEERNCVVFKEKIEGTDKFKKLISDYFDKLVEYAANTFLKSWPEEDAKEINIEFVRDVIKQMGESLENHIKDLHLEIRTYKILLNELKNLDHLNSAESKKRFSLEHARNSYLNENQENYTLSYLTKDGFFPGYAMGRTSVSAQCAEPFIEITRPSAVAIRELTPANSLYANREIFKVKQFNFYKLREKSPDFKVESLRKNMVLNTNNNSIMEHDSITMAGGKNNYIDFGSFEMIDVTLEQVNKIDDIKESRKRVGFRISGILQSGHKGGEEYCINTLTITKLRNCKVRLINLGTTVSSRIGFPICPVCGAVRNPGASEAELESFINAHTSNKCNVKNPEELWSALHSDIASDVLSIGEFDDEADAVNFMEALELGAYEELDMHEGDIDGVIEYKPNNKFRIIFYDPMPGGSGFLEQFLENYKKIAAAADKILSSCDCDEACYKCLLHFRNQQHHKILNRAKSIEIIKRFIAAPKFKNIIPASIGEQPEHSGGDSGAEDKFIKLLHDHKFPIPHNSQLKIDLGNLSYTVADYAYQTDLKPVLIYVDGLSNKLHGNPEIKQRDGKIRSKAKMLGYKVIEVPAQALDDDEYFSMILQEIADSIKFKI